MDFNDSTEPVSVFVSTLDFMYFLKLDSDLSSVPLEFPSPWSLFDLTMFGNMFPKT